MANFVETSGVALFGLGRIGRVHLATLLQNTMNVKLRYIVDIDIAFIEQAVPFIPKEVTLLSFSDADRVFSDLSVDAVLVCTPTDKHGEIVLKALQNGKHVFCEKPVANTYSEIEKCYTEAATRELLLFAGFNRRFDPSNLALQESLHQIQPLHVVKTCSRDPDYPSVGYMKSAGSIFHDMVIHDIDLICHLLQAYPDSISALASAHNADIAACGDFDTAIVSMKFPSGVIACVDVSRRALYGYDQRTEVFGAKGMLQCGNHPLNQTTCFNNQGQHSSVLKNFFFDRYRESYQNELAVFFSAIRGGCSDLIPTGHHVLNILRISDACLESAKTSKTVSFALKN